jgi:hypothetical protein
MGRGLTTDERAGTDTLSEAWLAQRLFTGTLASGRYARASRGRRRGANSLAGRPLARARAPAVLLRRAVTVPVPQNLNLKVYH